MNTLKGLRGASLLIIMALVATMVPGEAGVAAAPPAQVYASPHRKPA
jgi:hypothetical protein